MFMTHNRIQGYENIGGGRVERRCWVNFQCRGVLLIWMIVGQGPIVFAVGAGGGCLDFFPFIYLFSFLSPSLWETARYRLKYCLKGPLNPKQPTNHENIKQVLASKWFLLRIVPMRCLFCFLLCVYICNLSI